MTSPAFVHRSLGPALACALILGGCGGSDDGPSPEANSDRLNITVASVAMSQEELPFIGIVNQANVNTAGLDDAAQFFFPFGGVKHVHSEGYSRIGNVPTNTRAELVTRLYPNLNKVPVGTRVTAHVLTNVAGVGPHCLSSDADGVARLHAIRAANDGQGDIAYSAEDITQFCPSGLYVVDEKASPIEIKLLTATASANAQRNFIYALSMDGRWITVKQNTRLSRPELFAPNTDPVYKVTRSAESFIQFNDMKPSPLPDHVYAHGSFRPSTDGFGFKNWLDPSFDLYPPDSVARFYGKHLVCFVKDDACTGLTPFGYYLKDGISLFQQATGENGLCHGMAMGAMALHEGIDFNGKKDVEDYNPSAANTLSLAYSEVRHLIADAHMTQYAKANVQFQQEVCTTYRPTDVLTIIEDAFNTDDPIATLTMAPYNAATQQTGVAHVVTPWALSDEGDGIKRIYVYDSNKPADGRVFITVDTHDDAWYLGETAPSATGSHHAGQGLINPLCPQPLSHIKHTEFSIQGLGSTRFVDFSYLKNSQVMDPDGRIAGGIFDTGQEVNQIPDARLDRFGVQKSLLISGLSISNDLPELDAETLSFYLSRAYTVRAQDGSGGQAPRFSMLQSSILDTNMTSAYVLHADIKGVSASDIVTMKADPTARFFVVEKPADRDVGGVQAAIYTTLNDSQIGHVSNITLTDLSAFESGAVGFFVNNNGRDVVVFTYDPSTQSDFSILPASAYVMNTTALSADGQMSPINPQ